MRFQSLRIEISFIFKSNHITKAEICYIYGYGCVLLSFNYKVKAKKGKRKFCDTADFGNKRKKSGVCVTNGHPLILAQNGINEELHLMFVKQTNKTIFDIYRSVIVLIVFSSDQQVL